MSGERVRHFILGAAGHVDHGKTALIAALTGVNTDRLKEEQERGISIELGFAEFPLSEDTILGVVDMPGHERFVRQMVAGAGGVDLAFLVVAADEGVMPQTVEHLEILNALETRAGVIVLSKIDLVDEELAAVAAEEVRDLVAGTFLEGRPLVRVSAVTGEGLEELREALRGEVARLPERDRRGPFRLPIDRVFTLPGIGVIVTGACWSGEVTAGAQLIVQPAGLPVRVREVQAHGRAVRSGGSGQRLALALHGVKKEDLERGWQVLTPGGATPTRRLDLRVDLLPSYAGLIRNRQRLHVHHAGREVLGRIVLLDAQQLGGDGPRSGVAQLHLEDLLVANPGDRLVLRFYSPVTTIAGGAILAVEPPRRRRFDEQELAALEVIEQGDPEAKFAQELGQAGLQGLPRAALEGAGLTEHAEAVTVGGRLYHRQVLEERAEHIGELLEGYVSRHPLRLGIPKEEARRRLGFPGGPGEWHALCLAMAPLGGWEVHGDRLVPAGEPELPATLAEAVQRRQESLRRHGLQWPGLAAFREENGVPAGHDYKEEEFLRYLVERGVATQIGPDYYVASEALAALADRLRAHFAGTGELSFAQFRELSGLTRKLGIPLLEHLDQTDITVREGDLRRPGPALKT
jgi:selenocysteine-specific elongation factor